MDNKVYLQEAFKALDMLNEEDFNLDTVSGQEDFQDFIDTDEKSDFVDIIDPETTEEDELKDDYVGKIVLDCCVCHNKLYKDKEEIVFEDDEDVVNQNEECPICYSTDGFKIVGMIAPYEEESEDEVQEKPEEEPEEEIEVEDKEEVDESCGKQAKKGLKESFYGSDWGDSIGFDTPQQMKEVAEFLISYIGPDTVMGFGGGAEFHYIDDKGNIHVSISSGHDPKKPFDQEKLDKWLGISAKDVEVEADDKVEEGCSPKKRNKNKKLREATESNESNDKIALFVGEKISDLETANYNGDSKLSDRFFDSDNYYRGSYSALGVVYFNKPVSDNPYWLSPLTNSNKSVIDSIEISAFNPRYYLADDERTIAQSFEKFKQKVAKRYGVLPEQIKYIGDDEFISGTYGDLYWGPEEESDIDESLKESADISEYQKWVDFDMKKYGRISGVTMRKIKAAGFSVVKDQYGDYEVIADRKDECMMTSEGCHNRPRRGFRKVEEDFERVEIETDKEKMEMTADEEGKVTVTTEPKEETIVPVDDTIQSEINPVEAPEEEVAVEDELDIEEPEEDIDVSDFSEEEFDELGESYLKKIYENVVSYKTDNVYNHKNSIIVEGTIKFNSGNEKKTSFIFESSSVNKNGKMRLIGENAQITRGKKAFTVSGKVNEGKFIAESFKYNYQAKDASGKSTRIYGTLRTSK